MSKLVIGNQFGRKQKGRCASVIFLDPQVQGKGTVIMVFTNGDNCEENKLIAKKIISSFNKEFGD